MTKLIAVTGATGNQGGSVAKLLLQHPQEYRVRALTRNPDSAAAKQLADLGAEIVRADLTVPSDIPPALKDCWGVFGVTNFYDTKITNDPGSEEQQGKHLAKAALDAGVQCFVWSTLPSSAKLSEGKLVSRIYEGKYHVDDYIREISLPAVFVYTGTFYENLIYRNHVKYDKEQDIIEFKQPILLPETRLAMLYVEKDLSTIVKAIFDQWDTKHEDLNHKYLYAMNARVAQREITEAIEKLSGKQVKYTVLETTGVHDRDIMFHLYNHGYMYRGATVPDENVFKLLGVKFHDLEDFVRDKLLPYLGLKVVS
ncbi:hypothetical protein Plec18167_001198 [Paecilomyces lecythidis]|uniref:NmrA-like domain-containing protein n=1 Tax=Paecilomyces lecythidis TaxID=3004212 RepID=A0ABR3YD32_9EURO